MNRLNALRIPLVLILIFYGYSLSAQEIDHVYLKNGSVIRGDIKEIDPVDHVKIEDLCGNIWYYKISEVEKITSEPYTTGKKTSKENLNFEPGFVNMTSMGFLAGSANNAQIAPFSLLMINGWRFSQGVFAGIGFGVEFLSTNYFPFFADFRYDLLKGDIVPYIVAKGGYSFPMSSSQQENEISYTYYGGALAAAGIGLKIKSRDHFAWDISLMYRYQNTAYKEAYGWNSQEYKYDDIYNRIELRFGFYID